MNTVARVAADSVGAAECISVTKYPDGMFNKTFLMTMEDGREVVAKVPNPNAGILHFTTASEVATMDFASRILGTPAPHVHAWNSQAKSHPVGAEFILMDKVKGVPLSQIWSTMQLQQRLKVIIAMTSLQKKWLSVSFSHYGSLYYAGDAQSSAGSQYVKDGMAVKQSGFDIGPATGRDWFDADRLSLDIERGPWPSLTPYLQAIGTREMKAIQSLKPPKQVALFCGPKLYQPHAENTLIALASYQRIVNALTPTHTSIANPRIWHNDLHDDNIFVDPHNPERITGIIDWQCCHISPLGLAPRPTLSGLSAEEWSAAKREYTIQNVFIGWRQLMQAKSPDLYCAVEFRKTAAYGPTSSDLKDTWSDLAGVTSDIPFPVDFSEIDIERIKLGSDDAAAETGLVSKVKEEVGDLWPDKGLIEHERYDGYKAALDEVKAQILKQLA
ncbi:unnamed protein product [Penicillium discolor]